MALRAVGPRYDRARFAALPGVAGPLAAQVAAFANSTGGHIVLGAEVDPATGAPVTVTGISLDEAKTLLAEAIARVDPPVEHLVSIGAAASPAGVQLALVSVGQSPAPPHLVVPDGSVLISVASGVRSVRSRSELDSLYQRGRSERERADRQIEAMIEKLMQAHYAVYGIGFVACSQNPNAEPYLWARENAGALIQLAEPFSSGWQLTEDDVKVRPGEVEVRGEREAHGYIRLTRSGCAAVGEVRRRPPGNTLGTTEDIVRRVGQMIDLACAMLARAPDAVVVPRLFFEGLRSQRLVLSEQPYAESAGVELDTAQFAGNLGNPADPAYVRHLRTSLLTRLLAGFKIEFESDAGSGT